MVEMTFKLVAIGYSSIDSSGTLICLALSIFAGDYANLFMALSSHATR